MATLQLHHIGRIGNDSLRGLHLRPHPSTSGSISFDASTSTDSGATITDYSWDFGDGSSIDGAGATPTVAHQYANPGTYNVTLIVTNSDGQTETTTRTITVFTFSPSQPTPDSRLVSTRAVRRSNDSYSWSIVGPSGPNSTTTAAMGPNPTEALPRGTYQVTLNVTDGADQTATTTQTVTVDDPPTVALTAPTSPAVTQPNQPVSFSASGTAADAGGSIASYSWNFGDGSTDNGDSNATTTHTYASPGTYTATVTATDDLGVSSAPVSTTVTVDATPTAAFTSSPTDPNPGGPVSFDASGSTDSVGDHPTYSWNFGDTSANGPGTSTLEDPTYSYPNPGTYTVRLTVTNDAGQSATTTQTVTVDDPPTATLAASTTLTTPGSAVSFTSTAASPAAGGSITAYSWNFGDGSTLTGTNAEPTHAYASPGTYAVTLTVTDDLGVTFTASTRVAVDAAPTPVFTASSNPATAGSAVGFNAGGSSDSVGTITGYTWNFGDGNAATGVAPSHVYATPGTYTVSLTVTNDAGQSATRTGTLTVASVSPASASSPALPATPPPTSAPPPAPVPTPKPLTASLRGAKTQKLAPVLSHGLKVSLAVNQGTNATFQITLPVLESRLPHSRKNKNASVTLLRTRAQTLGAGTHALSLKLSRAAARELAGRGPLVLTVKVTLTGANGKPLTRTARITLTR